MKSVPFAGTVALLALSCGGDYERPSPSTEWYSGGTLHQSTVREWRAATYKNRLATSADFVMGLGKYQSLPTDLKQRAREFESCISEAVEDGMLDDHDVAEVGATCGVLLGY